MVRVIEVTQGSLKEEKVKDQQLFTLSKGVSLYKSVFLYDVNNVKHDSHRVEQDN